MLSKQFFLRLTLIFGLFVLLIGSAPVENSDYDPARAKLLGYMIKEGLPRHHYSHKELDDDLSIAAFDLYLEGLDYQKRFLLKADVNVLEAYRSHIDEELRSGQIRLPHVADTIVKERLHATQALVQKLLAGDFDFSLQEEYETDAEKLDYAATDRELKERWRKTLKYQILSHYIDLEDEEKANTDNDEAKIEPRTVSERKKLAIEKVAKSLNSMFSRLLKNTRLDYFNAYLNAVSRAYDPHTVYMAPRAKEDFDIDMRGSLEGIGATLTEENGYIKVMRVIPGSAAARQGELEAEDLIIKVAQGKDDPVDTTDTRLRDAVDLIRGKKGTEVRLTIKKPDARIIVIPIIRDVVQIEDTFVKSMLLGNEQDDQRFGFIKIPSFYRDFSKSGSNGRNATDDVQKELEKLKKQNISGLIIDLRNDGGGALTDAVKIAGLFIPEGPVVQVRTSDGSTRTHKDTSGTTLYDGPLVVLVNQFSASSSEILAGALQDYKRAVIVGGNHTHGKGTVQAIIEFDRGLPFRNMEKYKPLGALKVTIQKFYRVSGDSTQYRGVVPDIILPDRLGHLKTGEQYIPHSLPWDTVAKVDFNKWTKQKLQIEELKIDSQVRVAASDKFNRISEQVKQAKARSANSLRPLNLDKYRLLRAELKKNNSDDDDKKPPHSATQAGSTEEWIETVNSDPYVKEAAFILSDILKPTGLTKKNGLAKAQVN
jgi:carboxyl-terminal processing protease